MPALFDIGTTPGTAMAGNGGTKTVHAKTYPGSTVSVASTSLVTVLPAAFTIPANLLAVGDQLIFEGAVTINNTSGGNRTFSMNVGPFMSANLAFPTAHATATVRLYTWRLVTTIISSASQVTIGRFMESAIGTANTVFDEGTAVGKMWNETSTVATSAATTHDVKMLSTSATGAQDASLVSSSCIHVPYRQWTV